MISPGLLRTTRIWGLLTLLMAMVPSTREAPMGADSSRDLVKNWEPVQQYLHQYGYLTPSPTGADNLRTEEKLRQAVRSMQRFGGVAPTGVVDQDTLALMRRRRCGMPDMSQSDRVKRYAVQGQTWKNKNLTWSIKYLPSSMSEHQVRTELTRAFRLWSEVSLLSFRELPRGSSTQADIVVSFESGKHGDGYAFDGPGVVLAHAFFPGDGIGGDAHFDRDEPWVDRERPGVDGVRLFAVAAHEFGHSLGLSHSSVTGALMNPFYQPIQDNFELPYDDQNGIQNLYGSRNPNKWAPLDPYIPPRTTRGPPTRPPYRPTFRPDTRPTHYPPRHPSTARPPRLPDDQPEAPSTCNTTFDAVSVIRKEIYFFKGKYFWRFVRGELLEGYPAETSRFFYEKDLKNIDAVYERPKDMRIVFFSGPQYWVFDAHRKMPGYPRPLTDLGLPPDLKRIDAAMVWGHNGKTYFFSGKQYWRYDETEGRVELDYPRDMSMWRGVPYGIDAAFTNSSVTYFFKGRKFWKFDNARMRVENKTRRINEFWFKCPSRSEQALDTEEEEIEQPEKRERYVTSDSNIACFASNCVTAVSFAVVFLFYTARFILYL